MQLARQVITNLLFRIWSWTNVQVCPVWMSMILYFRWEFFLSSLLFHIYCRVFLSMYTTSSNCLHLVMQTCCIWDTEWIWFTSGLPDSFWKKQNTTYKNCVHHWGSTFTTGNIGRTIFQDFACIESADIYFSSFLSLTLHVHSILLPVPLYSIPILFVWHKQEGIKSKLRIREYWNTKRNG